MTVRKSPLIEAGETMARELADHIDRAGFTLYGPTDYRARENNEPMWVCRAREILADWREAKIKHEQGESEP